MAYFVEIQKYSIKYIRTVMGIMAIFPLVQAFGIIFVNRNVHMFQILFLSLIFMLGMFFLLSFYELKTVIKKEGIYIKFLPIHVRNIFYPWEEIENLEIIKYHALKHYAGWGYRPKMFGRPKAMTIQGTFGLKITFTSGDQIMVGTQRPDDLTYLISVFRDTQLLRSKAHNH